MKIRTPEVKIGKVKVGGANPIAIQSMTDTPTDDAMATAGQVMELADSGSELVRITVNTNLAARRVPEIRKILDGNGYQDLPLIGDFHYNGHILLKEFPKTAEALDKYRINPGNVGYGDKHKYNFRTIIKTAIEYDKPVRIGVNWGSLDQDLLTEMMDKNAKKNASHFFAERPIKREANVREANNHLVKPKSDKEVIIDAMVESALRSAHLAEKTGLPHNRIVLSVKMSIVQDVVKAYELLAERMSDNPYALHLGLTEAGSGMQGLVSSSAALAVLLHQGIGDTIRVSLTPTPDSKRMDEVEACKTLLQAMGYRHFSPQVTSCPGCGRTDSYFFQDLAKEVNRHLKQNMKKWEKKYPRVAQLKVAVMGCVVNGPGEAKHADIAISLPGKMEKAVAPVYIGGEFVKSLQGDDLPGQFMEILEDYIKKTCS